VLDGGGSLCHPREPLMAQPATLSPQYLVDWPRTVIAIGANPALQTFICTECGDVRAIEIEERPATT